MRERPLRLAAGGAMGRLFASICRASVTSRAPRINRRTRPELECGGARLNTQALSTDRRRGRSVPFASIRIWRAFVARLG